MPNTVISEISFSYCVWNVISPAEGHAEGYLLSRMNYNYKCILREDISYMIHFKVKKEDRVKIYKIRNYRELPGSSKSRIKKYSRALTHYNLDMSLFAG